MNIFKTKQGRSKVYSIVDDYITVTGKKPPYCVKNLNKESLYAVCPLCDNPIQIIGLYKDTAESGRKPYGKHYNHNLSFAKYNEDDYLDCPFSRPDWNKNSTVRRPNSNVGRQILDLLINQFDRVIYVLSKNTGIRISPGRAEKMLQHFISVERWKYRDVSLLNLPWKFGEAQGATTLFGSFIKENSEIYNVLKSKCPEINLVKESKEQNYVKVVNKPGEYCNLYYLFKNHKIEISNNGDIKETIVFWVYRGPVPNPKTVYEITIEIHSDYFQNLIDESRDKINRNERLLDIAKKVNAQLKII